MAIARAFCSRDNYQPGHEMTIASAPQFQPDSRLQSTTSPALNAHVLSFNYGERRALNGVSFSIGRGEIFGFLGPNGGGKTTLFKILSTLAPVQEGSVDIFGMDWRTRAAEIRRRLGVVFQHPGLDTQLTVRENLEHHGHLYGITGKRLREQIREHLQRLGLVTRINDLVSTLSGGLKRRAELAKALLHQPDLLLLDEPSTGLDPAARRDFNDYLVQLREQRGVTVVLTTHYLEEAERCDRVGILHNGELIAAAAPRQLKEKISGDIIVIDSRNPDVLARRLSDKMDLRATVVDGAIRIERPRAHELVRRIVDDFGPDIDSVTLAKPTLEDVFVRLTGHRFFSADSEEPQS